MQEHEAVRRLVKSPPELWTQCSDPASLARHLSGFGEIKITRLEPESTVAWEGESASGTVTLEASGWGTRVRLTAAPPLPETVAAAPEPGSAPEPPPAPAPLRILPHPAPRGLGALLGSLIKRHREVPAGDTTVPPPASWVPGKPDASDPANLLAELEAALDSLGQAHHRPYSR